MISNPEDLTPREAIRRWLNRRRSELTEQTASSYHYRMKRWVQWCENQNIERVSELSGWIFEQFEAARSGEDIAPWTLHNEMETLQKHVEYLERIEAVEEGLTEKIHVPRVPEDEKSRDTKLSTHDALGNIRFYRNHEQLYGSREHALLEIMWHTGARLGALRSLDLRDYDRGEQYVRFVHRPDTGTPLKNKRKGQRVVSLRESVCKVISTYIQQNRWDKHDEHGRQPLFTSMQGRPSKNSIRTWTYRVTQPCIYGPCPHGHDPASCKFRSHTHASKCPSSRSPHHVRTGSITWHRDRGVPSEVTAERVNASQDVIERYYDKATQKERMERRRRPHLDKLEI